MKHCKQQGYSLVELMVAVTLGLLVLTAVLALFMSMIRSDADNLKMVRLSQEMRAALSLISRDIRRSGAVGGVSTPTSVTLTWFSSIYSLSTVTSSPTTRVIFYYDANSNGTLDAATETFGYRRNSSNNTIVMINNGAWADANPITDSNVISITTLGFTQNCVNEGGIFMREITISLSGRLINDTTVAKQMTESVKIRNDYTTACP